MGYYSRGKKSYGNNGNSYDSNGYDREGYDRNGYDRNGRDRRGYDKDGYDIQGFNRYGRDRRGYDRNGLDRNGCDRWGNKKKDYSDRKPAKSKPASSKQQTKSSTSRSAKSASSSHSSSQHWSTTSKKGSDTKYLFDYVPTRGSSQVEDSSKLILSLKDKEYAKRNGVDHDYVVRTFAHYAEEETDGVDCVMAVPSSKAGSNDRGIDEIADSLNKKIGNKGSSPSLRRNKAVSSSHLSNERSTDKHLSTTSVVGDVRGKDILLIDDVTTSGASMDACAQKLMEAGAKSVKRLAFGATSNNGTSGAKKENAERMLKAATKKKKKDK